MWWHDPPKGFSLDRHIKKVSRMEGLMRDYLGKKFTEPLSRDMYETLASRLHYPHAANLAIRASEVVASDGREFTANEARFIGLALVENDDAFRQGRLPAQWSGTPPLWMCVRVTKLERERNQKPGARACYLCKCLVITGPVSGQVLSLSLSAKYAYYLPHILGVPKNFKVDPYDAQSMHGYARIGTEPGRSMTLMELEATSALKTKNKRIYRRRNNL